MKYAKSCGCFALRYGIVIIAVIDIMLSCMSMGFTATDLRKSEKVRIRNVTNSTGIKKLESNEDGLSISAVVNIVVQVLSILIAFSLIAVAVINTAQYRKVLLIWIGWTSGAAALIVVTLVLRFATDVLGLLEIIITVLLFFYLVLCLWFVISYYKLLQSIQNAGHAGYNFFGNQEDLRPV